MKKLMTIMAACVVAGLVSAQTVTSANIVGYKQVTLQTGFNMISLNWNALGGVQDIAINSLFDPTELASNLTAGATFGSADMIYTYVGGYTPYFYKAGSGSNFWSKVGSGGVPTTDSIPLGSGFWLNKRVGTATLTFAGEVNVSNSFGFVMEPGFNMVGAAYPVDVALNDSTTWNWDSAGVQSGATFGSADMIYTYIGGYTPYFYKAGSGSNFWSKVGSGGVPTTDKITLGNGVWYFRRGASPIVINQAKTF